MFLVSNHQITNMRVFLVLCAALAVAAAAVVPESESKPFASQQLTDEDIDEVPLEPLPTGPIEFHTFYTRQDHSRPQVRVPVRFVSQSHKISKCKRYKGFISELRC